MALNPQARTVLTKYTMAAKKLIYTGGRMRQFMQLLGSPEGAVTAVQSIIAVLEKAKPIPPEILPTLAVNCYLAMVDVAQAATKHPPDAEVMKSVISTILTRVKSAGPPPQLAQPQGIIARAQGVPA